MDTAVVWPGQIRAFEFALRSEGLRPKTVSNYSRSVQRFARSMGKDVDQVTSTDVLAYKADLLDRITAKSVHEAQQGLRRFFRFLNDDGELDHDPTLGLKPVRYEASPQPTYSKEQVEALLSVCNTSSKHDIRDRALVVTLFDTGVRVGELVSMGLPNWESRSVLVNGKTGCRLVFLGEATTRAIERYVRHWKLREGMLWRGKKGPLTESGVHQLIARLCIRAGVEDKGVHAFRRAAVAQMKRLGMQDSDIMEVMGWRNVTMLRRYTATVASELAQTAHRRFSPGDSL